ncbi:putative glycosyltransferase STELLO2 [Nymphon striatum]|nr:putative glycosyltransferase STELLO2 [Nymphon striatum]
MEEHIAAVNRSIMTGKKFCCELLKRDADMNRSGAQWIYTADHHSVPNTDSFLLDPLHEKLMTTELQSFNALKHFGQEDLNPFGFVNLSSSSQKNLYYLVKTKPVIQHVIVNHNLETEDAKKKDYAIDLFAPPVVLHPGTSSPFRIQRTIFHYNAFWGLLGLNQSTGDVLQSYWIETLLKYTDSEVMFITQDEFSTTTKYLTNFPMNPSRPNLKEFVGLMKDWQCTEELFSSCLTKFSKDFQNLGLHETFIPCNEHLLKAWIEDLQTLIYKFPKFVSNRTIKSNNSSDIVTFSPVFKTFNHSKSLKIASRIENSIKTICSNNTYNFSIPEVLKNAKPMFEDILLLIAFNNQHTKIIPLLEIMYRTAFPNMLICGNGVTDRKLAEEYDLPFYATDGFPYKKTSNIPKCIIGAMKMGYKVRGYFNIHDDVLLNFWHFLKFNKTKIWYLPGDYYVVDAMRLKHIHKKYFTLTNGEAPGFFKPVASHIQAVEALMAVKNSIGGTVLSTCHKNLIKLTKKDYRYINGQSDIFYIPSRLEDKYIDLMGLFAYKEIWFEISVPTVTRCLEHPSEHETIPFGHIYGASKLKWNGHLKYPERINRPYFHPFKLEPALKGDEKRRDMFCGTVIPQIFKILETGAR